MATSQVNNVQNVGGAINSTPPGLTLPVGVTPVVLYGGYTTPTAGNKLQFFKAGMTSQTQYRVPNGKSFVCVGFFFVSNSGGTEQLILTGYDTATFSQNSAVAGTDIYYASSNAVATTPTIRVVNSTASTGMWYPIPLIYPSDSYPFWIMGSNSGYSLTLIGYEI